MINKIRRNIQADLLLLCRSSIICSSLYIAMFWLAYVLYKASIGYVDTGTELYIDEAYIALVAHNSFVMIVVGAWLGTIEQRYRTYCVRVVNTERWIFTCGRIATIFLISLCLCVIHMLAGVIYDSVERGLGILTIDEVGKFVCVLIATFFLGCFSYVMGIFTMSLSISTTLGILYLFVQAILHNYLPQKILCFLPSWQKNNMLYPYLSGKQRGILFFAHSDAGDFTLGLVTTLGWIVLFSGMALWREKGRQY